MCLIHLTHPTASLRLAHLQCAQSTSISLRLGRVIEHKAFFMISVEYNLLNAALTVKNGMVVWILAVPFLLDSNVFHTIVKSKNHK